MDSSGRISRSGEHGGQSRFCPVGGTAQPFHSTGRCSSPAPRRALRSKRGSAGLEFAVVGGLFFVMLLAAVDLGRYYLTLHSVRTFAAEASRHGAVTLTGTQTLSGQALASAVGRTGILGGSPGVTLTRTETGSGNAVSIRVQVTVDHPFTWVINVFGTGATRFQESTDITFRWV